MNHISFHFNKIVGVREWQTIILVKARDIYIQNQKDTVV
jgi:hypothetical protein